MQECKEYPKTAARATSTVAATSLTSWISSSSSSSSSSTPTITTATATATTTTTTRQCTSVWLNYENKITSGFNTHSTVVMIFLYCGSFPNLHCDATTSLTSLRSLWFTIMDPTKRPSALGNSHFSGNRPCLKKSRGSWVIKKHQKNKDTLLRNVYKYKWEVPWNPNKICQSTH